MWGTPQAQVLINASADVNALSGKPHVFHARHTPIDLALASGYTDTAKLLVHHGAVVVAPPQVDADQRRIPNGAGVREDVMLRCCSNPIHEHAMRAVTFLLAHDYKYTNDLSRADLRGRTPMCA